MNYNQYRLLNGSGGESGNSMIFEILGNKVSHFEEANFLIFVEKEKCSFSSFTPTLTNVESMENNYVIPSLSFETTVPSHCIKAKDM